MRRSGPPWTGNSDQSGTRARNAATLALALLLMAMATSCVLWILRPRPPLLLLLVLLLVLIMMATRRRRPRALRTRALDRRNDRAANQRAQIAAVADGRVCCVDLM